MSRYFKCASAWDLNLSPLSWFPRPQGSAAVPARERPEAEYLAPCRCGVLLAAMPDAARVRASWSSLWKLATTSVQAIDPAHGRSQGGDDAGRALQRCGSLDGSCRPNW